MSKQKTAWNRKEKDSSRLWIRFFLLITLAAFVFVIYALFKETYKKYQIQREVEELKKQAAQLEYQNESLQGLVEYFETQNFSEKAAREKLNVKKEGEKVVILRTPKGSLEQLVKEQEEVGNNNPDLPNPLKWWNYFLNESKIL